MLSLREIIPLRLTTFALYLKVKPMAFSDYKTIYQVQAEYQIKYQEDNFVSIKEYQLSSIFIEDFTFNQQNLDIYSSVSSNNVSKLR